MIHSYYQASLVCEFIEEQAGRQALVQMLEAYREGLGTEAVFRRVLDTELDSFSERFFDYLSERFAKPLAALRPAGQEHGRPADPAELARRARTDSGDFFAQLGYGRRLFEQGVLEEALVHLERAKALFPDYAGPENPYWYLAQIHKQRGAWERAAAELEALTAINERSYRGNLELAEIEERLGDPAAAAAALDRLLYVYPYDMALHARLADLYAELEIWARAVKERRAVLALDPVDRAEALYLLARAYVEAGDLDNARRTVLEALELAPLFERAQELLLEIRGVSLGGRR